MKKHIIVVCFLASLFYSRIACAQSFTVANDTMYVAASGTTYLVDDIIPITGNVKIKWEVVANTFPVATYPSTTLCDNSLCYQYNVIGTTDTQTSGLNFVDSTNSFSFTINIDTPITSGTYYLTVRMSNDSIPADTARETYLLTFPTAVQNVKEAAANIHVYPNPAAQDLNISLTGTNATTVAVYDMAGKLLYTNEVHANAANISVANLATGIYFVRVLNDRNATVAIRRFIK